MDTIYFRARPQNSAVQINFHYVNTALQLDRVFNLERSLSETLDACLGRIKANVEKELQKKQRRKKAPKGSQVAKEPEVLQLAADADDTSTQVLLSRLGQVLDGHTVMRDVLDTCPSVGTTDLLLTIFGVPFKVCYNLPWVNLIVLPTSMMAGYFVYPTKLDMECAELRDCTFQWFKVSMDKYISFGICG